MDTPRRTKLYNKIAKDYHPKQAAMNICRYIEGLEERIEKLENAKAAMPTGKTTIPSGDVSSIPPSTDGTYNMSTSGFIQPISDITSDVEVAETINNESTKRNKEKEII